MIDNDAAASNLQTTIDRNGFAIVPGVVAPAKVAQLMGALENYSEGKAGQRGQNAVHAIRNLLDEVPSVRELADAPEIMALVEPMLGPHAFVARAILFDKVAGANWKVPWHQDLSIAVRERKEVAGFGPWSEKARVPHTQPPTAILERMLTLRLHLDDCHAANGPLLVLPSSHRYGRLDAPAIQNWRAQQTPTTCLAHDGDVLLMRPLLLHASSAALQPGHRRVVHLEYAAEALPGGLEWQERWGRTLSVSDGLGY